MQVPYYFTWGDNERRNAVVVYFASVPFLAWVSLHRKVCFPSQWSCWVLCIIPVSINNFCVWFFLKWFKASQWSLVSATRDSCIAQPLEVSKVTGESWGWPRLVSISGQGHSLENSLNGLFFFQSTRGLLPLRATQWLNVLQKRPQGVKHTTTYQSCGLHCAAWAPAHWQLNGSPPISDTAG